MIIIDEWAINTAFEKVEITVMYIYQMDGALSCRPVSVAIAWMLFPPTYLVVQCARILQVELLTKEAEVGVYQFFFSFCFLSRLNSVAHDNTQFELPETSTLLRQQHAFVSSVSKSETLYMQKSSARKT